jgi:uncharacterized Zn finger protein
MRENLDTKTKRLLTESRVFIRWVTPELVSAMVHGDHGVHQVDLQRGRWSCTCQATGTCSHLEAVMLVTVPANRTSTLDELLGKQREYDFSSEPF